MTGTKYEKAFGLDMPFDDALGRFAKTDPRQLPDNTPKKKKKSIASNLKSQNNKEGERP